MLIIVIFFLSFGYVNAALDDLLLYYWDLEDTTANLGGYDMTAVGSPSFATGKIGNGLSCTQNNHLIQNSGIPLPTINITINYWMKINTKTTYNSGFSRTTVAGNPKPYDTLWYDTGTDVYWWYRGDGSSSDFGDYNVPIDTNWHMWTLTKQGTTYKIYKDGLQVDTESNAVAIADDTSLDMAFCQRNDDVTYLIGLMDEVGIWNRTLTDDEINISLYNYGNGIAYANITGEGPAPEPTFHINSSLENDAGFDDLTLNISYNGTFANENTTIATCSLWENNVLVNQSTGNISYNNFFVIDTSFRDGTYLYSINCSNYEIYGNTSVFTYVMDTYSKSLSAYVIENNEKINEIYTEVMTMIPIIMLYLGLLFFGYWMITTYNFWLGMPLILGTMMFDVHLAAIYYNTYLGVGAFFLVMLLGKIPMMWFLRGRRIKG